MSDTFNEGSLSFDFSNCGKSIKFDEPYAIAHGLKAVDFFVESDDTLYFIGVKDYQNPNSQNKNADLSMLTTAIKEKKSVWVLEIGAKIKDSLLRCYAEGRNFNKKTKFLLLLNLDVFGEFERGKLREKIKGHVPTGLNAKNFSAFSEIEFKLVNVSQINEYGGIVCTDTYAKQLTEND